MPLNIVSTHPSTGSFSTWVTSAIPTSSLREDFPVFRMKARRVVENAVYINEIPMGSLGDVSYDSHMREIPYPEADKITFFIYEEIAACKKAAENLGLSRKDIDNIFYGNSARIFNLK